MSMVSETTVSASTASATISADEFEGFELSPQQKRLSALLAAGQEQPQRAEIVLRLAATISASRLVEALNRIVSRHEILRTFYRAPRGVRVPFQVIAEPTPVVLLGEEAPPVAAPNHPALEARLAQLPSGEGRLTLSLPALSADRRTLLNLADELARELASETANGGEDVVQYADVAPVFNDLLVSPEGEEGRLSWQQADLAPPALTDLVALPARPLAAAFRINQQAVEFAPDLAARLDTAASGLGVERWQLLLAGWWSLLWHLAGQRSLTLGVAVEGRGYEGLPAAMGLYSRTLPLALAAHRRLPLGELATRLAGALERATGLADFFAGPVGEAAVGDSTFLPFIFERAELPATLGAASGLRLESCGVASDRFAIRLLVEEGGDGDRLSLAYDAGLYTGEQIEELGERLRLVWAVLGSQPSRRLGDLSVLSRRETAALITSLNHTNVEHRRPQTLAAMVAEQAELAPDAVALCDEETTWSHGYLAAEADTLARLLVARGVVPGALVGICLESGPRMVAALLAVLRAGAAYVPLDPSYPKERLEGVIADAALALVLVEEQTASLLSLPEERCQKIGEGHLEAAAPLPCRAVPEGLAYVLYTSGSTGRPKGVMVSHRAIVNRLHWMQRQFPLDTTDAVIHKTPLSFDASIWELFVPLGCGARLVLAGPRGHQDMPRLVRLLAAQRVTVLQLVPSMVPLFLAEPAVEQCRSLKRLFCGGEALPQRYLAALRAKLDADLINLYGPTESSIDATFWKATEQDEAAILPIGRPLDNIAVYNLNTHLRPVPAGAPGELAIGGRGLAMGYLGRPALTAEKFVPDPFAAPGHAGGRLYLTGDQVRQRPDGTCEFLGRADQQVKLRGNRIELAEVESALAEHPAVDTAVVSVIPDPSGEARLVAHYVPSAAARELAAESVFELPNGLPMVHLSRLETEVLYREIFAERTYLQHGIQLPESGVVVDVGANVGMFTLFVYCESPGCRIFAFEPVPDLCRRLKANVSLYGIPATVFQSAVGRAPGRASFTYYPNWSGMSSLFADRAEDEAITRTVLANQDPALAEVADELLAGRFEGREIDAEVSTLAQLITHFELPRIDLLKIDVERAELEVLAGLGERDWPKIDQIVIEAHERGEQLPRVIALLAENGFHIELERDGLLAGTGMVNVFAIRRGCSIVAGSPRPLPKPRWSAGRRPLDQDLREALLARLPASFVPSFFVALDDLPRLPNGKLDRARLPAPDWLAADRVLGSAPEQRPSGPTQELLAGLWRELLGVENVAPQESFLALGGHSLLAMQLVSRLRELGAARLQVRDVLETADLAELALRVEAQIRGDIEPAPPIVPVDRAGDLPLSFAQQRLFFLDQLHPGSAAYNVPVGLEVVGELEARALRHALSEILRRHEALRTVFVAVGGHPAQRVQPPRPIALPWIDLAALAAADLEATAARLVRVELERPFDLGVGPLLRLILLRLGRERHQMIGAVHHIAADGWSTGVMVRELGALYNAFSSGQRSPLPELAVQYGDYAVWQRRWLAGEVLEGQLSYWRRRLAGAPSCHLLPTDRERMAVEDQRGATLVTTLSAQQLAGVREMARRERATPFMVLLAAFQALVSRLSAREDVVVGTDVANRGRAATENLIGFFVNILPLRTGVSARASFSSLLRRVRELTLEAYAHQDLPFDKLVEELRPERLPGAMPLVQLLFVLQNTPYTRMSLAGLTFTPLELPNERAKFDLALFLTERGEQMSIAWNYRTDLFDRATILRLSAQYEAFLTSALAQPEAAILDLILERHEAGSVDTMHDDAKKAAMLAALLNTAPEADFLDAENLVRTEPPPAGKSLPLTIAPNGDDIDVVEWARHNREFIDSNLRRYGALRFRGFELGSIARFEAFAAACCDELYGDYGDLPDEKEGEKVYRSTPYPPDRPILFHNESSHMARWPTKQFFYCVTNAKQGGETPLLDCREVARHLPPEILALFRQKGLLYVRNFIPGVDVSWQDFFHTQDRAEVERRCRDSGLQFAWSSDGATLTTRQPAAAVLEHPVTGETVFFNQLQLHHSSCLEPEVRESMLSLFGPGDMPRNVLFGDGSPIDDAIVEEIGELYWRLCVAAPWDEGDVVMVDNMLVAHARKPFSGPRKIVVAMGDMMDRERLG